MPILIFAPWYEPAVRAGGPARSLTNLVHEVSSTHRVFVVARDRDFQARDPYPGLSGRTFTTGATTVHYLNDRSARNWLALLRLLHKEKFDLVMLNSIWDHKYALLPAVLGRVRVIAGPVLLMPRGELDAGALALKAKKKKLFAPTFRFVYRRAVDIFAATSDNEASSITEWFPGKRVLRVTNIPDKIPTGVPEYVDSGPLRLIFMSRINRKKGLDRLLSGLGKTTRQVHLDVYGPIEDPGYWDECREELRQLPNHVTVQYRGTAERSQVPDVLRNADCMVLLTAGENYGHIIAESLQVGCPVMISPHTPWTDAVASGGGSVISDPDDRAQVADAIDLWAGKSSDELRATRRDAREAFVKEQSKHPGDVIQLALTEVRQLRH